ncbi:MAG: hypothetical protein EXS03_00540 [Phycisphaerales bacterium]|nr:hypothetical protein [Phycisphaerales bacterium]
MAYLAPQNLPSRPTWTRIGLAIAIAVLSDLFSFFTSAWVITEPIVLAVDVVTAAAIWMALGCPAILLVALLAEAIPGVGMLPLWTMVVLIIASTGRLPGRGGNVIAPVPNPTDPPRIQRP